MSRKRVISNTVKSNFEWHSKYAEHDRVRFLMGGKAQFEKFSQKLIAGKEQIEASIEEGSKNYRTLKDI